MSISIRRAGMDDADAIAPLFDLYRTFYQQPSDPALAHRFIGDRLQQIAVPNTAANPKRLARVR